MVPKKQKSRVKVNVFISRDKMKILAKIGQHYRKNESSIST
jgi:hypothetical protein